METQLTSAPTKQKHPVKGQRKPSSGERKLSAGPVSEPEHSRRLFVSSTNKRAIARFAKGPTESPGFLYPRQRVAPVHEIIEEFSHAPLEIESQPIVAVLAVTNEPDNVGEASTFSKTSLEQSLDPAAEFSDHEPENVGKCVDQEATITVEQLPIEEVAAVILAEEEMDAVLEAPKKPDELNVSKKMEGEELPDDTVGPDDSRSSESELSEEESEAKILKPAPVVPAKPLKPAVKSIVPTPVVRKVTMAPALPVHRKTQPAPVSSARSSWLKFLPLVIEVKATIPYPMHLLGVTLFLVASLILGLSYQFGADLGSDFDLQGQFFRLLKLAFLFAVVAMCVNFVEDNKESQKDPVSPSQPKLRPSKVTKNKKKLMMKA